jgi:uncharacterized protein (TIGR02646 family)
MSYKELISFKIDTPYICSEQDNIDIQTGKTSGKKWGDKHYQNFKNSVRNYLKRQQKKRCGFCRLRISESQFYPHLEHIVPKSVKPTFEFLPTNLVYACQRCNFGKGVVNTLVNKEIEEYPSTSDAFNIVNPYFDEFNDFLDLIEDIILIPIGESEKGKNTIRFYNLNRIELAEDRAYELKILENNLTTEQLIGRLSLRLAKENDIRMIKVIERLLEKIPDWVLV